MAKGKDESNNPKRRPQRSGYSSEQFRGILDDLAYGKKKDPKEYNKKPIEDWGLDWPED